MVIIWKLLSPFLKDPVLRGVICDVSTSMTESINDFKNNIMHYTMAQKVSTLVIAGKLSALGGGLEAYSDTHRRVDRC